MKAYLIERQTNGAQVDFHRLCQLEIEAAPRAGDVLHLNGEEYRVREVNWRIIGSGDGYWIDCLDIFVETPPEAE